jgi:mono/diheme cytochrome c family protein
MILAAMHRRAVIATSVALAAGALGACGSESNDVPQDGSAVGRGAQLFAERCSGCHTFDVVGTQGSAENVSDQERVDGPNFNVRPETAENVLYAIRNGGFSGAIMPENIVVGEDAQAVAEFVAKYAGK